jgi:ABC-type multidrug transport system, ATPase component
MAGEEFLIESDLEALKPIDLSWNDLTCAVKLKQGEKQILKGISGYALHNELLVLMGSSGAGKTTLLNILSDKLQNSAKATITGQVLANGSKISKSYSNYIGYVTQEDILVETMTVYESLLFVANLKTNYINKKAKVLEIIDTLKLENCKNTLIGGHFRKGVSGGEKKEFQ